jgi:hypothetical protein
VEGKAEYSTKVMPLRGVLLLKDTAFLRVESSAHRHQISGHGSIFQEFIGIVKWRQIAQIIRRKNKDRCGFHDFTTLEEGKEK